MKTSKILFVALLISFVFSGSAFAASTVESLLASKAATLAADTLSIVKPVKFTADGAEVSYVDVVLTNGATFKSPLGVDEEVELEAKSGTLKVRPEVVARLTAGTPQIHKKGTPTVHKKSNNPAPTSLPLQVDPLSMIAGTIITGGNPLGGVVLSTITTAAGSTSTTQPTTALVPAPKVAEPSPDKVVLSDGTDITFRRSGTSRTTSRKTPAKKPETAVTPAKTETTVTTGGFNPADPSTYKGTFSAVKKAPRENNGLVVKAAKSVTITVAAPIIQIDTEKGSFKAGKTVKLAAGKGATIWFNQPVEVGKPLAGSVTTTSTPDPVVATPGNGLVPAPKVVETTPVPVSAPKVVEAPVTPVPTPTIVTTTASNNNYFNTPQDVVRLFRKVFPAPGCTNGQVAVTAKAVKFTIPENIGLIKIDTSSGPMFEGDRVSLPAGGQCTIWWVPGIVEGTDRWDAATGRVVPINSRPTPGTTPVSAAPTTVNTNPLSNLKPYGEFHCCDGKGYGWVFMAHQAVSFTVPGNCLKADTSAGPVFAGKTVTLKAGEQCTFWGKGKINPNAAPKAPAKKRAKK